MYLEDMNLCMGNRMIADNKEMARTNAERIY